MENLTYHRAMLKDIPLLVNYRIEFLKDYWGEQPPGVLEKLKHELIQYFEKTILDSTYISWYAMEGIEFAGIGGLVLRQRPGYFINPTGLEGYIVSMYTIPKFRRRGIASMILQKLQESAQQMGVEFFELHASKEGEHVYIRNGFKIHSQPTYRKFPAR